MLQPQRIALQLKSKKLPQLVNVCSGKRAAPSVVMQVRSGNRNMKKRTPTTWKKLYNRSELHNKFEIDNIIEKTFKVLFPNEDYLPPAYYNDTEYGLGHSYKYFGQKLRFNKIWPIVNYKLKALDPNSTWGNATKFNNEKGCKAWTAGIRSWTKK